MRRRQLLRGLLNPWLPDTASHGTFCQCLCCAGYEAWEMALAAAPASSAPSLDSHHAIDKQLLFIALPCRDTCEKFVSFRQMAGTLL